MKHPSNAQCPCHSTLSYKRCCRPYHRGHIAPTAEALMRSRFSAYALHLADYIMETTAAEGFEFQSDKGRWRREIQEFSKNTRFETLRILEAPTATSDKAWVSFYVELWAGDKEHAYTEKSLFHRQHGVWKYVEADALEF